MSSRLPQRKVLDADTVLAIYSWPFEQVERRPYLLVPMGLLWVATLAAGAGVALLAMVGTLFWLLAAPFIWLAKR